MTTTPDTPPVRLCAVEGCTNPAPVGRGRICRTHVNRKALYGDYRSDVPTGAKAWQLNYVLPVDATCPHCGQAGSVRERAHAEPWPWRKCYACKFMWYLEPVLPAQAYCSHQ